MGTKTRVPATSSGPAGTAPSRKNHTKVSGTPTREAPRRPHACSSGRSYCNIVCACAAFTYTAIDNVLERWIEQEPRPHASLEAKADEVVPEEVPRQDDEEWWAELLGEEETLTLGDLIPDAGGTDAWDQIEPGTLIDRIKPPPTSQTAKSHTEEKL